MRRGVGNERERLLLDARRAKAKAEARAVAEGVAETVALELSRGAAFEAPAPAQGERQRPYRRQAGLDWLARKGRLTKSQKAAGERYRDAYRFAQPTVSLGSTLEVQPGRGSAGGPALNAVLARAAGRHAAAVKLALYRGQLSHNPTLIQACDLVCGRELTPREAAENERDGLKLEAVLMVALDLLAEASGSRG